MPRTPVRLALLLLALGPPGCGSDEPVLQGVPDAPLLTSEPTAPAAEAPQPERGRSANIDLYEKPATIWVDARYLGGRSYREARPVVARQLGALVATTDLPGGAGQELRFTRGDLRVVDDRIYMVRVPLPEPMRRGPAMEAVGFPPAVGKWLTLHREYRLNNERGFRRLRLKRLDRASELVTEVEAWRWIPGEHGTWR